MLYRLHIPWGPEFVLMLSNLYYINSSTAGDHYRSDHHRYNMKRRVASLPPIGVAVFNQKVLERKTETAVISSTQDSFCQVCKLVPVPLLIVHTSHIIQQNVHHRKRLPLPRTI